VSIISDANMAWMLADAANVCLTGQERTMAFVELGCGENHLAIGRILNAVMSNQMMLPVAIFDRLTRWLDGYAGLSPGRMTQGARTARPTARHAHCREPARRSAGVLIGQRTALRGETVIGNGDRTDGES
jgi:hypothetical protein